MFVYVKSLQPKLLQTFLTVKRMNCELRIKQNRERSLMQEAGSEVSPGCWDT